MLVESVGCEQDMNIMRHGMLHGETGLSRVGKSVGNLLGSRLHLHAMLAWLQIQQINN